MPSSVSAIRDDWPASSHWIGQQPKSGWFMSHAIFISSSSTILQMLRPTLIGVSCTAFSIDSFQAKRFRQPSKRTLKGSNIKRLSPSSAEVWEFKVKTRQQIRVFGRFAAKDLFVAITGPVDRANCDFAAEKIRCQQEWSDLLLSCTLKG